MALTGKEKPDHSTVSWFRSDHREALARIFVQVLSSCRDAGMAKLGHVALDGTKLRANASTHSAMSHGRMKDLEPQLAALVDEWLETARETDPTSFTPRPAARRASTTSRDGPVMNKVGDERGDEEHGAGRRGDELPEHVKEKVRKLLRLREAKARLEREGREEAQKLAAARSRPWSRAPPRGRSDAHAERPRRTTANLSRHQTGPTEPSSKNTVSRTSFLWKPVAGKILRTQRVFPRRAARARTRSQDRER